MTQARDLGNIGDTLAGVSNVNIDSGTLFVDAINNRIGVGTTTPATDIHIYDPGNEAILRLQPNSTGAKAWDIISASGTTNVGQGSLSFYDRTANSERMRIDSSGRITTPGQPAFIASSSGGTHTITPGNVIDFNVSVLDRSNNYNTSTYRFTAPVSGYYYFYFQIYEQNGATGKSIALRKNGSQYNINDVALTFQGSVNIGDHTMNLSILMNLAVNDYVDVAVRTGASNVQFYGGHSWFMGYLLG